MLTSGPFIVLNIDRMSTFLIAGAAENVAGNRQQGEQNMAECTETPNVNRAEKALETGHFDEAANRGKPATGQLYINACASHLMDEALKELLLAFFHEIEKMNGKPVAVAADDLGFELHRADEGRMWGKSDCPVEDQIKGKRQGGVLHRATTDGNVGNGALAAAGRAIIGQEQMTEVEADTVAGNDLLQSLLRFLLALDIEWGISADTLG